MIPFPRMIVYGNNAGPKPKLKYVRSGYGASSQAADYYLYDNGELYARGQQNHRQFGIGSSTALSIITKVQVNVKECFSGPNAAFLIMNDNTIMFAGDSYNYKSTARADQGTWLDVTTIMNTGINGNIVNIQPISFGTVFLTDTGNLYGIGSGNYCGITATSVPVLIDSSVKYVQAQQQSVFYINTANELFAVGTNNGSFGNGTTVASTTYQRTYTDVDRVESLGVSVSIIRLMDGTMLSSGGSTMGLLGIQNASGTVTTYTNLDPQVQLDFWTGTGYNSYSTNCIGFNNSVPYGAGYTEGIGYAMLGYKKIYEPIPLPADAGTIRGYCTFANSSLIWDDGACYFSGDPLHDPEGTGSTSYKKVTKVPYY